MQLLLILSLRYVSFVSNVLYSIFTFKQCRKAKLLRNRTLNFSLGVTIPPVTPIIELDLGLLFFFFTRLCPSLSPLYTLFIITIIYYYHLYFVEFNPWKRQNELCNHFEGYLSSIKFTIDLASHILHSLLGTMFTVSVLIVSQSYRHVIPSDKLLKNYRRFISNHLKEIDDLCAISKVVPLKVQGQWTRWFNYSTKFFVEIITCYAGKPFFLFTYHQLMTLLSPSNLDILLKYFIK